jgi:D-glycero-D-manno-heptose 1,7-bisphosphate phosphatase
MLWEIDNSWTLFLDRDGVINQRIIDDYVKTIDEFKFIRGAETAIAEMSKIFRFVFVVTNQQGIGKGIMTESNLLEIHAYMTDQIQAEGGQITACYFAPQLASEGSELRKPATGMGIKAQQDFEDVDFSRSIMVGDSDSDIEFGKRLGMKTVKVSSDGTDSSGADLVVKDLSELLNRIGI